MVHIESLTVCVCFDSASAGTDRQRLDMDHHIPALDWSRSKQIRVGPVPVGPDAARYRPAPVPRRDRNNIKLISTYIRFLILVFSFYPQISNIHMDIDQNGNQFLEEKKNVVKKFPNNKSILCLKLYVSFFLLTSRVFTSFRIKQNEMFIIF